MRLPYQGAVWFFEKVGWLSASEFWDKLTRHTSNQAPGDFIDFDGSASHAGVADDDIPYPHLGSRGKSVVV